MSGIPFVVERSRRGLVPGLRVELQQVYGQRGIVAWNTRLEPGGC